MDHYEIWADLAPGANDLEFCDAVHAYLGYLREAGTLHGYSIRRRKFGFSPPGLGDFWISITVENLAQLDEAFSRVARRDREIEALHAAVFSRVQGFKSALYRDFPDAVRERP
ncbi:MAG: hypothetical protein KIS66_05500 [Fimbriimonadaceae bacterium]|nr:hypothetical protein [Fimbriimonadaceae bacterium]